MHIEDRGMVYDARARPPSERVASFTSLCRLASGTLLCGFQIGQAKHSPDATIRLCRSHDGGRNWQIIAHRFPTVLAGVSGSLACAELIESISGRLLLFTTWFDRSDPARPLFDPVTEGILHSRQLVASSTDEGNTWSDWRELVTPGLTGCASTGPPVRWGDGTIGYAFESYKEHDDPRPSRHGAWLTVSRDDGATFGPPRLVAQHPEHKVYYWDQRLCATPNAGEFLAMFWTHDLEQKRDLAVHFRHGRLTHDALALGPLRDSGIPGQIAAPYQAADGRLMAFVVDRGRPGTMRLWTSADAGHSWPPSAALLVYSHDEQARLSQGCSGIDFRQYWEDMGKWTFGHPAVCPLGEGRLLLAFYAGTPSELSIHWVRVNIHV